MTADVYALFGVTPERLKEIREAGAEPITPVDFDSLNLQAPGAGDKVVGELTDAEAEIFYYFVKVSEELELMSRVAMGEALKRVGESIKHTSLKNDHNMEMAGMAFESPEDEYKYCRLAQLLPHLKAMIYYTIGERLGIHDYVIGVRSKRRVVTREHRLNNHMVK